MSYSYENVGVKLGAKILGIDQSNYVTFTMTPVVTGISGSFNIVGCGAVSQINNRRLDTGAIRNIMPLEDSFSSTEEANETAVSSRREGCLPHDEITSVRQGDCCLCRL